MGKEGGRHEGGRKEARKECFDLAGSSSKPYYSVGILMNVKYTDHEHVCVRALPLLGTIYFCIQKSRLESHSRAPLHISNIHANVFPISLSVHFLEVTFLHNFNVVFLPPTSKSQ